MLDTIFDLPAAISGPAIIVSLCTFALFGLVAVRRRILPRLRVRAEDSEFSGTMVQSVMVFYGLAVALIAVGFLLVGIEVSALQAAVVLIILLLTFFAFLTIGMLSASFVIIFKRGDPIGYVFGWSSFLFGGVLFPVEVLPAPLPLLSNLLPITHAAKGVRELLLARASLPTVAPLVLNLCLFIVIAGPVGVLFFRFAVRRARNHA